MEIVLQFCVDEHGLLGMLLQKVVVLLLFPLRPNKVAAALHVLRKGLFVLFYCVGQHLPNKLLFVTFAVPPASSLHDLSDARVVVSVPNKKLEEAT